MKNGNHLLSPSLLSVYQGWQTFFWKKPDSNYRLDFVAIVSVWQLLKSAFVIGKQPQTIL